MQCLEYSLAQKCILEMQSFSVFHYEQLSRSASPPNTCSQGHQGHCLTSCVQWLNFAPLEIKGVFLELPVEMGFSVCAVVKLESSGTQPDVT